MLEGHSESGDRAGRREAPGLGEVILRLLASTPFIGIGGILFFFASFWGIAALSSSGQYPEMDSCESGAASFSGGIGLIGLGLLAIGVLIVAPLITKFSFANAIVNWTLGGVVICAVVGPILLVIAGELGFSCALY